MTVARSVVPFYKGWNTTPVFVVVTCPGNNKSFKKSHKTCLPITPLVWAPTAPPQALKKGGPHPEVL